MNPDHLLYETLVHTKLEIPSLTNRILRRSRLTALLEKQGERKVTVLSAPAGYGKTTLIGEWLSLSSFPEHRTAWVTLDRYDNNPFRFWEYLFAAINKAYPSIRCTEDSFLRRGYEPQDFLKLIPLINEVGSLPGYLNLILDDYHVITDPLIHEGITYLLDHQPRNLHIVISSRIRPPIPLARLQMVGRLVELTYQDLSFSFEETRRYLGEMVSKKLHPDEIVDIFEITEGWITGVKMAVLAPETLRRLIDEAGSELEDQTTFPDYFSEEILKSQPEDVKNFLFITSLLSEFSAELCDELLETSTSRQIILNLVSQNLFIERLDSQGIWYRYHRLFARSLSMLVQKTNPSLPYQIWQKAMDWFLRRKLPEKAVIYAVQSGHEDHAAEIIDTIAWKAIIDFDLAKIIRWINAMPDSLIEHRPRLGIYHAIACFLLGQNKDTHQVLNKTEQYLSSESKAGLGGEEIAHMRWQIEAIRASVQSIAGDHASGFSNGLRLLEDRLMESDYVYAMLTYAMAMSQEHQGLLENAAQYFGKSRQLGLQYRHHYGFFHSTVALAGVHMRQACLREAQAEFRQALNHALDQKLENAAISLAQTGLLNIALEKNDLIEADMLAHETLHNFDKTIVSESVWIKHIERCVALADYFVSRHDTENARDYFERALSSQYGISNGPVELPASMIECYGRILLAEIRANKSKTWQQEAGQFLNESVRASLAGKMLLARIYLAEGKCEAARDLMVILVKQLRQTEYQDQIIRAFVLFALSLYQTNDKSAALMVIEDALQMGSLAGYARVFTEEGEPMLALLKEYTQTAGYPAFEQANPDYIPDLLSWLEKAGLLEEEANLSEKPAITSLHLLQEPLSEREMQVLKLLNSTRSTKEVADALMISFNTAKTHIMNIYRKFGVHSRKMLIDRINELS